MNVDRYDGALEETAMAAATQRSWEDSSTQDFPMTSAITDAMTVEPFFSRSSNYDGQDAHAQHSAPPLAIGNVLKGLNTCGEGFDVDCQQRATPQQLLPTGPAAVMHRQPPGGSVTTKREPSTKPFACLSMLASNQDGIAAGSDNKNSAAALHIIVRDPPTNVDLKCGVKFAVEERAQRVGEQPQEHISKQQAMCARFAKRPRSADRPEVLMSIHGSSFSSMLQYSKEADNHTSGAFLKPLLQQSAREWQDGMMSMSASPAPSQQSDGEFPNQIAEIQPENLACGLCGLCAGRAFFVAATLIKPSPPGTEIRLPSCPLSGPARLTAWALGQLD